MPDPLRLLTEFIKSGSVDRLRDEFRTAGSDYGSSGGVPSKDVRQIKEREESGVRTHHEVSFRDHLVEHLQLLERQTLSEIHSVALTLSKSRELQKFYERIRNRLNQLVVYAAQLPEGKNDFASELISSVSVVLREVNALLKEERVPGSVGRPADLEAHEELCSKVLSLVRDGGYRRESGLREGDFDIPRIRVALESDGIGHRYSINWTEELIRRCLASADL